MFNKQKLKLNILRKHAIARLLLASLLAAIATSGVAANEIWLSSTNSLSYLKTQTDLGSGTTPNPYYGDFDYIMGHNVAPNTVVHLGSGIFWSTGVGASNTDASAIPAGVTLKGDGEAFTTIRRATNYSGYVQQNLTLLESHSSNITICDLTLDCNAFDLHNNHSTNGIGGVGLLGSGETLEHVTDINGIGYGYSVEGFQLVVGNYGQNNNKVMGCTVSNFLGNYGDGIAPSGDCLVEGNKIYFPVQTTPLTTNWWNPLFGINVVASSKGSMVINNYVYGGGDGFHNDTAGDTNLIIANNVFENVCEGVALTGDQRPYNSVTISHNLILMQTNYLRPYNQEFAIGLETLYAGQTNLNIVIDGNIIRLYHDQVWSVTNVITGAIGDGSQGAIYIHTAGAGQLNENISIVNNQIDARLPIEFVSPISNLYASGNIPLNGTNFATANGHPGLTNVAGLQT
ncbi:MAG TPA: hypothetical protein VMJ12_14450, partial [Candidatus Acidoferrales bacterium]|nr:hypothetical protein [Candidatus Acidoferrales bacterium]